MAGGLPEAEYVDADWLDHRVETSCERARHTFFEQAQFKRLLGHESAASPV
ncbi:MAG: hypothetical protein P8Y71_16400 [Pseudolabrys sp.]